MRRIFLSILFPILLGAFVFQPIVVKAQFEESRKRKKIWKRWRRDREAYNPYLDKRGKPTREVSKQMAKDNKRAARSLRREKKKQDRKSRRKR